MGGKRTNVTRAEAQRKRETSRCGGSPQALARQLKEKKTADRKSALGEGRLGVKKEKARPQFLYKGAWGSMKSESTARGSP